MRRSISRRSSFSRESCAARLAAASMPSASRHSIPTHMSASRPAALSRGAAANPRSAAVIRSGLRAGGFEQRADTGNAASGAYALQALRDQDAVVPIQRNDVGDRAERDQIEEFGGLEIVAVRGVRERGDDVERDADAGQGRAAERRPGEVRIDDHVGARQRRAGQMMIGHEHLDAQRPAPPPRPRCWTRHCRP